MLSSVSGLLGGPKCSCPSLATDRCSVTTLTGREEDGESYRTLVLLPCAEEPPGG
jgi:hypothetical protein